MSYADTLFIDMCRDILENGTDTRGEKVRPVWEDGTPAYTIKKFCVVNRYDLRKEFPALTLRKTNLKNCVDELLWIWQKKSNNIHDLHSHIWDSWADEEGSIGTAYGYAAYHFELSWQHMGVCYLINVSGLFQCVDKSGNVRYGKAIIAVSRHQCKRGHSLCALLNSNIYSCCRGC